MNRPIRVALGHLKHSAAGVHSGFMPVGIGYIGAYAISRLGRGNIEVRLYENPDELIVDIDAWQPDVIGLAHYCWNSELSELVFRFAKKRLEKVICVGGGSDFPTRPNEQLQYLLDRPEVDFFAYFEGEKAFASIVQQAFSDVPLSELRLSPQVGMASIHPETHSLLLGAPTERVMDMDVIPSPYVMGLMDKWFDGQHPPSIETSRGCPYSCKFCVQGVNRWSQLARFSIGHLREELGYIAEKIRPYPGVLLSICDSNFGMYKEDEEFAELLREFQDTVGWPNAFDVTTGKSQYDRILRVADRLKNQMFVSLSVQSLNQPTLEAIKRKNLSWEKYLAMQNELRKKGVTSEAETIMPLPEETKETYFDGLKLLINAGIQVISYTTMMLKGTELASPEFRERYGMVTRFRILPRQVGEYLNEKCFEVEEVCVATNTFSFSDYLECRSFALVVTIFSGVQYSPFRRLIKEFAANPFDWYASIWNQIKTLTDSPLAVIHDEFMKEVQAELFSSREEIYEKFAVQENYKKLISGELGDNLMRKYLTKAIVFNCEAAFDLAIKAVSDLVTAENGKDICSRLLPEFKQWLMATRNLKEAICEEGYCNSSKQLSLSWDFEAWLMPDNDQLCINNFFYPKKYEFTTNEASLSKILTDLRAIHGNDINLISAKLLNNWGPAVLWRAASSEVL